MALELTGGPPRRATRAALAYHPPDIRVVAATKFCFVSDSSANAVPPAASLDSVRELLRGGPTPVACLAPP